MRQLLEIDDRKIHLVGTAHVSAQSVEDVRHVLAEVDPECVAVELCPARLQTLTQREAWLQLDVLQVLRDGKAMLLLSSLVMTSFQRRIADKLGVVPGAEMLAAVEWAKEHDRELLLIDRDIQATLKRTWAGLGFFTRLKTLFQMIGGLFVGDDLSQEDIEQLKQEGQLTDMLESLARALPAVKETLIDERDRYMAEKLRRGARPLTVAVVGAGHGPGIREQLQHEHDLEALERIPDPPWWPRLLQWGIPIAIVGLLAYGFVQGGIGESARSLGVWFGVNGTLSALGAAAAFGHPLTVVSAFLAAPLTSLNPMVAAGWVAGLVQAWVKRPTIRDLENLPNEITTVRGFWHNPVSRVLLVVALANLGSMLGTWIAGSWILARTL